ncbi:MAG: hypothetical protein WAN04_08275, partial [Candidatus Udaeobacter sp.]
EWYTPWLSRDFEMLVFGNGGGLPLINHMGIEPANGTTHATNPIACLLNSKGIKHWLDDGKWRGHDWNYWRDMLPYYLSKIV